MKLLTPPGTAGIAVVRASADERPRLLALLRTVHGAAFSVAAHAPPRRAELRIGDAVVDDVLVVDRGADGLEIHVHGAPAVVDALCAHFDVRAAEPTTMAERLLWRAMSPGQLRLALEQLRSDVDAFLGEVAAATSVGQRERIEAAMQRSRIALAHVEPQRVVLVGRQNAGKSSLLNALLLRERVLAGPQPGLTRDPVAEVVALDGYPYEVVDTAGEGPVASVADADALAKARAARDGAMTILVVDRAVGPTAVDCRLAVSADLVVANKTDLVAGTWPGEVPCDLEVSCARDEPGRVRRDLGRLLRERRGLPPAGPVGGFAVLSSAELRRLELRLAELPH